MKKYFNFQKGNSPLIITIPHGGNLKDDSIPARKSGSFKRDINTILVGNLINKYLNKNGLEPYVVTMNLHRRKIDVNRGAKEGAQCPKTLEIHRDYHQAITVAKKEILNKFNEGLLIDLHGQRLKPLIEIGYGLSALRINKVAETGACDHLHLSSFNYLLRKGRTPKEIIFGKESIGNLLEKKGYQATPSTTNRKLEEMHFNGVYTLSRHVVSKSDNFWGINLELLFDGIRDSRENAEKFAQDFTLCLIQSLESKTFFPYKYKSEKGKLKK